MRTKTVKIYKFDELSDEAKEAARDWYREGDDGTFAWENTTEDAKNIGLIIITLDPHRSNKGRFEKYAEDTANRILREHGETCETYKTAKAYLDELSKLERDENGDLYRQSEDKADELEREFLHDILEDYRIMHEKDIEFQNSDEQVDENIRINEYEFLENGKRA